MSRHKSVVSISRVWALFSRRSSNSRIAMELILSIDFWYKRGIIALIAEVLLLAFVCTTSDLPRFNLRGLLRLLFDLFLLANSLDWLHVVWVTHQDIAA